MVVNNSLRLVRLEAAVCSTLSASLRCVFLNSESSKTSVYISVYISVYNIAVITGLACRLPCNVALAN